MTNQKISTKKLKAIVFTDIVDFTKISAEDEQQALGIINKQRELLKPIVLEHKGEWLKEIGDGLLFSFDSSLDAVQCSIKIQEAVRDVDNFKLRIGIHQGDIYIQDGDVYGDDVNIASRVEGFSPEGGISISDKVYKDIQGVKEIKTSFIGHRKLKGVKQETKIRCVVSDDLPKHKVQFLPLFTGYLAIFLGSFYSLIHFGAIILFSVAVFSYDAQINNDLIISFYWGCALAIIGFSNIMYVKGVSIKSQRLFLYLSYFIFITIILKKTILSGCVYTTADEFGLGEIEGIIRHGYYYSNDSFRTPVESAIEGGMIEFENGSYYNTNPLTNVRTKVVVDFNNGSIESKDTLNLE